MTRSGTGSDRSRFCPVAILVDGHWQNRRHGCSIRELDDNSLPIPRSDDPFGVDERVTRTGRATRHRERTATGPVEAFDLRLHLSR